MRRADRGLTLLEVLGAVALLGILYTALAGSAIEGLRSEGESRRRLRASLLADERMAEIELSLGADAPPPLGSTSLEQDGFTIETRIGAFEPPPPRAAPPPSGDRSLAARRAEAQRQEAPSLFDPPASAATPPALRTIEVVVRWEEGIDAREVRRTTYALDAQAIEAVFAAAGAAGSRRAAEAAAAEAELEAIDADGSPILPDFEIPGLLRPPREEAR